MKPIKVWCKRCGGFTGARVLFVDQTLVVRHRVSYIRLDADGREESRPAKLEDEPITDIGVFVIRRKCSCPSVGSSAGTVTKAKVADAIKNGTKLMI